MRRVRRNDAQLRWRRVHGGLLVRVRFWPMLQQRNVRERDDIGDVRVGYGLHGLRGGVERARVPGQRNLRLQTHERLPARQHVQRGGDLHDVLRRRLRRLQRRVLQRRHLRRRHGPRSVREQRSGLHRLQHRERVHASGPGRHVLEQLFADVSVQWSMLRYQREVRC